MYKNIQEMLDESEAAGLPLWQVVLNNEVELTGKSEEEIYALAEARYNVMRNSSVRALEKPLKTLGGLIDGLANRQYNYYQSGKGICGNFINKVMALALSSSEMNASMGKICAAPTAGSCGILPAVLIGIEEEFKIPHKMVIDALITASGVGAIITKNATVAGAEGGCQAECGVAAAMAACAATQMFGGSPEQIVNACSLAIIDVMGLVCDPVAGLVQVPCAYRNASQAVNALISADMSLAGIKSIIPPDEVIEASYNVGRMLPVALRETALGGIAATKTAQKIAENIFES